MTKKTRRSTQEKIRGKGDETKEITTRTNDTKIKKTLYTQTESIMTTSMRTNRRSTMRIRGSTTEIGNMYF